MLIYWKIKKGGRYMDQKRIDLEDLIYTDDWHASER